MSTKSDSDSRQATSATDESDPRRDDTISRIRSALIHDRLTVVSLTEENTGTDPYNSGVHRALAKAHIWRKGAR